MLPFMVMLSSILYHLVNLVKETESRKLNKKHGLLELNNSIELLYEKHFRHFFLFVCFQLRFRHFKCIEKVCV